ncbi:MAG: hypothetical protein H7840_03875 [Alphaproteobacteria bacterium]
MSAPVCSTIFDVLFWYIDRALNDNEYLQPQKMHRVLYLSQAYYAAINRRVLMPAVFVAHELGPLEPNVFRIFSSTERPYIEHFMLPENVEHFLDSIWRRFGHHSGDYLTRLLKSHQPYAESFARGAGSEITIAAMASFYGRPRSETQVRAEGAPDPSQVLKPRVLRTQTGKPVAVKAWSPGKIGTRK